VMKYKKAAPRSRLLQPARKCRHSMHSALPQLTVWNAADLEPIPHRSERPDRPPT
jgi:hypothetical protein